MRIVMLTTLSYGEAIDQMKNGQCDAAFVTSGLPNATVSDGIQL